MVSDRARIHVGVCEFTGYATPSVPEPTVFYPKKLTREVHNMLVGDWGAGGHTFVTWWKGSNQSRDFWVETPEEMVRIHVIPRKRTFDPGLWTTKYTHLRDNLLGCLGQARRTEAVPCVAEGLVMHASECLWRENDSELRIVSLFNLDCGSVAAASRSKLLLVGLFRALQLERCMSAPALKSPLKAELQAELEAYSVVVHHKWTVPELRSLVIEQRQARGVSSTNKEDPMAGITKMTLAQLKTEATKQGLTLPEQPTRGLLMRMLRDAQQTEDTTVLPFGKYKGWHYVETPQGYTAIGRSSRSGNSHPDLVRYANWAAENEKKLETMRPDGGEDLPGRVWEMAPVGNAKGSRASGTRRPRLEDEGLLMNQDLPSDAKAQMEMLEAQLAALKQKHGFPRGRASRDRLPSRCTRSTWYRRLPRQNLRGPPGCHQQRRLRERPGRARGPERRRQGEERGETPLRADRCRAT